MAGWQDLLAQAELNDAAPLVPSKEKPCLRCKELAHILYSIFPNVFDIFNFLMMITLLLFVL